MRRLSFVRSGSEPRLTQTPASRAKCNGTRASTRPAGPPNSRARTEGAPSPASCLDHQGAGTSRNSPSATITAEPPTSTRSMRSVLTPRPVRKESTVARSQRPAGSRSHRRRQCVRGRGKVDRERSCRRTRGRVLQHAATGANMRVFQLRPDPAKQLTATSPSAISAAKSGFSVATASLLSSST